MENAASTLTCNPAPSSFSTGSEKSRARTFSTIISTGGGRLHFLQTANALQDAGVNTSLILGLVPNPKWERLYTLAGRLVGRKNLGRALNVRVTGCRLPEKKIHSCGMAETAIYAAMAVSRFKLFPESFGQALTWKYFGRASKKYLGAAEIFHVRSGAGQGGAITAAKRRGMKVVVDHSIAHPAYMQRVLEKDFLHRGRKFDLGPATAFWKLVLQDCAEADVLLVNSDFVRETFIAEGFSASRIAVAYLGTPLEFCRAKQHYAAAKIPQLLYTGSFGFRKGADTLLAALKVLKERGLEVKLNVVGHTPETELLEVPRRDGTSVEFHGVKPQQELKTWIRDADLYVFPTLAEGCAKSAMEAMAAGLPVVTTRACGLPGEPDRDFALVPSRDPEALARRVQELLADSAQREAIGRAGAELVATRYQWSHYAASVIEAYARAFAL